MKSVAGDCFQVPDRLGVVSLQSQAVADIVRTTQFKPIAPGGIKVDVHEGDRVEMNFILEFHVIGVDGEGCPVHADPGADIKTVADLRVQR